MPIIEPPPSNRSLSQGDVLEGITLFSTAKGWDADKGTPEKSPQKVCMILSRPCVIEHRDSVVVLAVEKLPDNPPRDTTTLEKVLSFLNNLRDGSTAVDVFYLGQLPMRSGRFGAKFDEIYTLQLPPCGLERQSFVETKRIGILNEDFRRDLHARLFRSVASLGFDDYTWLPDSDLKWLVESGKNDLLIAQTKVQEQRLKQAAQDAQGSQFDSKSLGLAQAEESKIQEILKPYLIEYERRGLS